MNERAVLRFLKLIQCDNGKIGTYAKLVKDRNETAHSNGNIFFASEAAIEIKIVEILRAVAEIQEHSRDVIQTGYRDFLIASSDFEEREFPDDEDQIRELLVHANYMSTKDLEYCRVFDIETLSVAAGFPAMQALHCKLAEMYPNQNTE